MRRPLLTKATLPNPRVYDDPTTWALQLVEVLEKTLSGLSAVDMHRVGTARNPAFQNGWQNVTGFMGAYFYSQEDLVVVGGVVEQPAAGGPAAGEVIFTLPLGYRPEAELRFALGSSAAMQRVSIEADGEVKWISGTSGAPMLLLGLAMSFPAARL